MSANLKVVVGLGKTGLSCVHYLLRQGYKVAVTDSRANPPGSEELKRDFPHLPLSLNGFDAAMIAAANELIVSPGVSLKEPLVSKQIKHGTPAIGDIELFARTVKAPVIGITGTNGKSTVTTLVGEMAKAAGKEVKVGGNLGTPALDLLDERANLYVLELSSFQLETTSSLNMTTAVVLNISPDHLDRYADMQEYIAAKQKIYQQCQIPVINRDDPISYSGLKNLANVISFGMSEPAEKQFGIRENYLAFGEKKLLAISELKIKGKHQQANALAALALGYAAGLPMSAMVETLKIFSGLAHRCQWISNINDVDWYNDSKGTNVYSSLAAIEGLGNVITGKLILIAGGLGKQQDFSPLHNPVQQYVREVILIGQDARLIADALQNTVPLKFAKDLEEAVQLSKKIAQAGDAVLLSPACASFDMFQNFEHRGQVFMDCVRKMGTSSLSS